MANLIRPMHITLYRDSINGWRWRLVGGNGEKFAASQAYATERGAKAAAQRLIEAGAAGIVWKPAK